MKTTLVESSRSARFAEGLAVGAAARNLAIVPSVSVPAWQTAPWPGRVLPQNQPRSDKPARRVRTLRIAPGRESIAEKIVMGLLATAAIAAIAYGFGALVDLVQHWATFNAGIGQLIQ